MRPNQEFINLLRIGDDYAPVCNPSASFPGSLSTPTLWFKPSPTASVDTTGFNTATSSGTYTRWYDFSGNGRSLNQTVSSKWYGYSESNLKGGNLIFSGGNIGDAKYTYKTGLSSALGTSGKGTVIVAWKAADKTGDSSYTGNHLWFAKDTTNPPSKGYVHKPGEICILGDVQNYSFSNITPGSYVIQAVSVTASGNPLVYRCNGVQGSTSSYNSGVGAGIQNIVSFDLYTTSPGSGYNEDLLEFIYYDTALTSAQCQLIEDYLMEKWCIDY